jgi:hypothetical protein
MPRSLGRRSLSSLPLSLYGRLPSLQPATSGCASDAVRSVLRSYLRRSLECPPGWLPDAAGGPDPLCSLEGLDGFRRSGAEERRALDRLGKRVRSSPHPESLLQLDDARPDRTLDEHVTSGIERPLEPGDARVEALPAVETAVHLVADLVPVLLPRVLGDSALP